MAETLNQTTAVPADHYDGGSNLTQGNKTNTTGVGTLAEVQENLRADTALLNAVALTADERAGVAANSPTGADPLQTLATMNAAISASEAGLLDYKGGYDANTNTPDLDTAPSGITKGDAYTVTAAGAFFTENVEAGDMLIAEVDAPTLLTDWTIVNKNLEISSVTNAGAGDSGKVLALDAGGTAAGRVLETDGAKLDGIEALADVTDQTNVNVALGSTDAAAVNTSAGVGDAGKLAKLDAAGLWDSSMIPAVTDSDAIHDNVAAEVSALTEKAVPVSGDHLLIEDSAAANVKKRVQVGNLPNLPDQSVDNGAAPVLAVTNMTGSAAGLDSDATAHAASDGSGHADVASNTAVALTTLEHSERLRRVFVSVSV